MIGLIKQELTQKRLRTYLTEQDLKKSLTYLYRSSRIALEEMVQILYILPWGC